jgi:hypothetical protein
MAASKIAVIKLNIETGEIIGFGVEGVENGAIVHEGEEIRKEVEGIKQGGKYGTVAQIILTPASAGCLYWDGQRWIRWC